MPGSSASDPDGPAKHAETGSNSDNRMSAHDETHTSADAQTALTVPPKTFAPARAGLGSEMDNVWDRLKDIIITKGILTAEEVTEYQYDKKERIPEGLHASWPSEMACQRVKWVSTTSSF